MTTKTKTPPRRTTTGTAKKQSIAKSSTCILPLTRAAVVKGFGRSFRATTFFRCKDKILRVQCGCFYGDLTQFREIVKKTHGNGKRAKEYLAIADLMELHFSDEEEKKEATE